MLTMHILTVGSFDIPHFGHALFLFKVAQFAERLTVGVNSDEYILQYKGEKPIMSFIQRSNLVLSHPFVDEIVKNTQDDLKPLLLEVQPDLLAIGSDWEGRYNEQIHMTDSELLSLGVRLIYLPYTEGISSSYIKELCQS